jgi:hypothetical protein
VFANAKVVMRREKKASKVSPNSEASPHHLHHALRNHTTPHHTTTSARPAKRQKDGLAGNRTLFASLMEARAKE